MRYAAVAALCGALMAGCSGKGNAAADGSDSDSSAADSAATPPIAEAIDTNLPIFAGSVPDNALIVYYWSQAEEPQYDAEADSAYMAELRRGWLVQEAFRAKAAAYTNLFMENDRPVKVKYRKEQWKDADGNDLLPGEMHFKPGKPNCGAYYDAAGEVRGNQTGVLVTDEYLQGHKPLALEPVSDPLGPGKPMSREIVEQLEQKYGMKASRSQLLSRIGGRYAYGFVQFEGVWKDAPKDPCFPDTQRCLAVDVLAEGDRLYLNEQLGSYESPEMFGWNVDDDGQYSGCWPVAAFEGDDGLTLCYIHTAPESLTVGIFGLKDGRLTDKFSHGYHMIVDE